MMECESGSSGTKIKSPKGKTKNGKSPKGKKKSTGGCVRARIWTNLELEAFARILADVDEEYAMKLEQMALKKSSSSAAYVLYA